MDALLTCSKPWDCDGQLACMCNWACECSDCQDEPHWCFNSKEDHQEFVNRKSKENPETIPMIPEN